MVELIAHRVMVMYLGRVVETAPARVAKEPAHPYSRLLWSAVDPYTGRRMEAGAGRRWELSEGDRPRAGCRFRDRCPVYQARGEPAICRDKETEPALTPLGPGHTVACHFPQGRRGAAFLERGRLPLPDSPRADVRAHPPLAARRTAALLIACTRTSIPISP